MSCGTGKVCSEITPRQCVTCVTERLKSEGDGNLGETNPHDGCDELNPVCVGDGYNGECFCESSTVNCETATSTRCTGTSGSAAMPVYGTCKCGDKTKCDAASTTPSCLLTNGDAPTEAFKKDGTSCQVNLCYCFSQKKHNT